MAVVMGSHDPEWNKYFVAVALRKEKWGGGIQVLGAGTLKECRVIVENQFLNQNVYKSPARLVSFTGGILELKVIRRRTGIDFGSPRVVAPFYKTPSRKIPSSGHRPHNPAGVDWHNFYCLIDVVNSGGIAVAKVEKSGAVEDCKYYMDVIKLSPSSTQKTFILLSADGHVYQFTAVPWGQTFSVKRSPSVYIKPYPLFRLWR
ncbi:MAG: hypothetical protein WCI27_11635 [Candidatus Omnitrophota bacterium]